MRPGLTYAVLCAAAAIAFSGCGQSASPSQTQDGAHQSPPTGLAPATTRGLAAAVLAHFRPEEIGWMGGEGEVGTPSVSFELKGKHFTSWSIDVWSPTEAPPRGPCGRDSGYHVVACRTLPAGDRIEVLRGPARTHKGVTPMLIGRAYRTDGSQILLEVHAVNSATFPAEQAERLLSDRLVGWQTSQALNDAGRRLRPFHRTRSYATTELRGSR